MPGQTAFEFYQGKNSQKKVLCFKDFQVENEIDPKGNFLLRFTFDRLETPAKYNFSNLRKFEFSRCKFALIGFISDFTFQVEVLPK